MLPNIKAVHYVLFDFANDVIFYTMARDSTEVKSTIALLSVFIGKFVMTVLLVVIT